jgi:hypothetical protein
VELRKLVRITRNYVSRLDTGRGRGGLLDATQAFARVMREVAFAQLAIIDDIDSDSCLVDHYLAHGARKLLEELGAVGLAGCVQRLQGVRAWHRSGVRNENAVCACAHAHAI